MFPEGTVIICGIQRECKGDPATGELTFEIPGGEDVNIPCCQSCWDKLDSMNKNV